MTAEIHYLGGNPTPIGQFIRVGHSGHRQLEAFHNTGRIQLSHVVIDAAQIDAQNDLVNTLRESGTEIVLDTNVAELSSVGRFDGVGQKALFLTQRRKQLQDLERIHHNRRVAHFIDHHLASADRIARQAAKLKIGDGAIFNALQKATNRLDRMRGVLEDLDHTIGSESTRSASLKTRTSVQAKFKQKTR